MAMKTSTPWVVYFFVLALGSTLPSVELAAAVEPVNDKARTFLASLGERAIHVARNKTSPRKDRELQMRALLREGFDLKVLARVVLGKHWRQLDRDQRVEFVEVFEDAMVQQTLAIFGKYKGETFKITGVGADSTNPKLIAISVDLIRSNGALLAKVNWRIRTDGQSFKVVDIVAEGVSMALTLRQEYATVIERSDGNVDGLIDELRKAAGKQSS